MIMRNFRFPRRGSNGYDRGESRPCVGKMEYRGLPDSERQVGAGLAASTAVCTATAPPRVWHIRIDPFAGFAAILVAPFV